MESLRISLSWHQNEEHYLAATVTMRGKQGTYHAVEQDMLEKEAQFENN